ncbi:MAG: MCE family protein [Bacteroidetes bacterium]|nr:MAG: MCE family protein [Bacteroidota bacterium]
MFKVSNETKIGALTAVAITMLILGVNFLKGRNLTRKTSYLYAKFEKINGLLVANPVIMSGLSIGTVYKTEPADANLSAVIVTIRLDQNINIPNNSVAEISTSLLGSGSLVITKGSSATYLQPNDTLATTSGVGFLGGMTAKLEPTQAKLEAALASMDSVLKTVNQTLNTRAQADLQQTLANFAVVSANLTKTTAELNALMAPNGNIAKTAASLASFTAGLDDVKTKLPAITQNLETGTKNLSQLDLDKTLRSVNEALASFKATIEKLSNSEGTLGALMNDRKMYNNLTSTVNSLNLLLQDLRLSPKRYINVSVFGKKDKSEPLMRPMPEDSLTQEQRKQ